MSSFGAPFGGDYFGWGYAHNPVHVGSIPSHRAPYGALEVSLAGPYGLSLPFSNKAKNKKQSRKRARLLKKIAAAQREGNAKKVARLQKALLRLQGRVVKRAGRRVVRGKSITPAQRKLLAQRTKAAKVAAAKRAAAKKKALAQKKRAAKVAAAAAGAGGNNFLDQQFDTDYLPVDEMTTTDLGPLGPGEELVATSMTDPALAAEADLLLDESEGPDTGKLLLIGGLALGGLLLFATMAKKGKKGKKGSSSSTSGSGPVPRPIPRPVSRAA